MDVWMAFLQVCFFVSLFVGSNAETVVIANNTLWDKLVNIGFISGDDITAIQGIVSESTQEGVKSLVLYAFRNGRTLFETSNSPNATDIMWRDPKLDPTIGVLDAQDISSTLQVVLDNSDANELTTLVSSPLSSALQTATEIVNVDSLGVLWPTRVVFEVAREKIDELQPSHRSDVDDGFKENYTDFDFSSVEPTDPMWTGRVSDTEGSAALVTRARLLVDSLFALGDLSSSVALASHTELLGALYSSYSSDRVNSTNFFAGAVVPLVLLQLDCDIVDCCELADVGCGMSLLAFIIMLFLIAAALLCFCFAGYNCYKDCKEDEGEEEDEPSSKHVELAQHGKHSQKEVM
jgi:broad specificity phosphatase PhoE